MMCLFCHLLIQHKHIYIYIYIRRNWWIQCQWPFCHVPFPICNNRWHNSILPWRRSSSSSSSSSTMRIHSLTKSKINYPHSFISLSLSLPLYLICAIHLLNSDPFSTHRIIDENEFFFSEERFNMDRRTGTHKFGVVTVNYITTRATSPLLSLTWTHFQ